MAMVESNIDREDAINDAKIEQMLSEKLMAGYVLMEATCPKCAVPLVKNHQMVPKSLSMDENDGRKINVDDPVVLPAGSFEQPFKPVDGVPMCVACSSHVITSEMEIAILEQDESVLDKGSIYVALEAATEPNVATLPVGEKLVVDGNGEKSEVINLENITEDDVIVGEHRKKFMVDIETVDMDGMSNVEMVVSPKIGDALKPINIEDVTDEMDPEEQAERREIATKVLGAKMLQGWTLKEKICNNCAMPVMTYKGKESCPVCPALAKRAKKKLKQQAKKELIERTEQFPAIQARREEVEIRAAMEDEEATVRAEERKRAIEDEKERLLALDSEKAHAAQEEKKEDDETVRERARALVKEEKMELKRLEAIAKEEEERREILAKANGKDVELALKETIAKQEAAAKEVADEAQAIEALDDATIADDKTVAMKKDLLVQEHRKTVANKAAIDEEVAKLEEERLAEAMEARRIAEERRIESESRMIAALEADAAVKALAAEEAIRRAKAALQEVADTKQQIISNTIEQAEREALAETEEILKDRFEEHNEPMIVQTKSEIVKEQWETLRMEGRAIMTRRVLKGWSITSEACLGVECYNSPLIEKDGIKECVVCGGCGTGKDGAYETPEEQEGENDEGQPSQVPSAVAKSMAKTNSDDIMRKDWLGNAQEEKFEQMREIYSKEIGKKMLMGWKLVDSSCPKCVMPMMMDDKGNTDICIVKGCKGLSSKQIFDASTIATKDMAETFDEESHKPLSTVHECVRATPSDESDLASIIQKQAPKQQEKRKPVVSSDPPAYKPSVGGVINRKAPPKTIIPLPTDFADAAAIRELVGADQGRDDKETSVDTVAGLFLKSPHGYDFQEFGKSMDIAEVKELVEIFLVTNLDKHVSDTFKLDVAKSILSKTTRREASSPLRTSPRRSSPLRINTGSPFDGPSKFIFDDNDYVAPTRPKQRAKPYPEKALSPSKLPPLSPGYRSQLSPTYSQQMRSPRSPRDDVSVLSRASTVASDALESIYDRIDQCKKKLLDPNNSLDEQIATAALLEKLAQAAVAVKEMEVLE